MSNNTIVRGLLVPSLKNKPLDGRQDVPTLADIVNIENPYVNFIFPVAETGKWYKVLSLTDKVIDELVIPNGMIDEYEEFGGGMTDTQKKEYLKTSLAEQMFLKKEDAVNEYLNKTEAEADYLKKKNAEESYQPKGNYQPSGEYATKQELEDLENRISQGGGTGEGGGGSFIDAPSDNEVYGRKNGLWEKLVDAPKDGKAYARINGVWAPIESGNALDPMLPVLSLTIGSSIENDATIAKVAALVSYADKEFMLGNGGKMNVPYGLDVTVTFPNIDNYSIPESVMFEDVQSDIAAEGTYINLQEVVNVYVSADDGSAVDGQVLTVGIASLHQHISNGVYIEDTDGVIYTKEQWDGSKPVNSIVFISDGLKVRTYSSMKYESIVPSKGSANPLEEEQALLDMDGETNTSNNANRNPFGTVKNYTWPNGISGGYIPAFGELNKFYQYWDEYVELRTLLGLTLNGNAIVLSSTATPNIYNSSYYYNWGINVIDGSFVSNSESGCYFIFSKITEDTPVKKYRTEKYEVLGGQVSFGALQGDEVTVSINAKEGGYSKPEDVSFVVGQGGKNVSFVYNKLIIDTIYINNLIADTSSIISGEMNGKAVQAIWNNVHRYLGKIVTKEDSTNELVLLDIDQNDNRYYTDGSMIDLEALGTNAYFFTKVPSMSYKITQMSDNIYKVQISYKHKPGGEGWRHFDELIVPTFNYSNTGGLNERPTYYGDIRTTTEGLTYPNELTTVDVLDYSNIALLLYAKYGVGNIENVEEFDLGTFVSSGSVKYYKNGFSLRNGKKDAKYKSVNGINYIYNFLGIENFVLRRRTITDNGYIDAFLINGNDKSTQMTIDDSYSLKVDTKKYLGSFHTVGFRANTSLPLYIKKLIIDDVFLAFGLEVGGSSETYYKESIDWNPPLKSINYPASNGLCGGRIFGSYNSSNANLDKLKYVGEYRIESERESFESLTNIWV